MELDQAKQQLIRAETELSAERKNQGQSQEILKQSEALFENLANKIFSQKQETFKKESKESMSQLLSPLKEEIGLFKKKVEESQRQDGEARVRFEEQLKHLHESNRKITEEAHNLTQALKSESKTRGNWGEMILERVLESSGLREGHEFEREKTQNTPEGRVRPDVIVHLPDDKDVIIDAKLTLIKWEKYVATEEEQERSAAFKAHLLELKTRVKELADKKYDEVMGVRTLDYVLMFIPIEAAYVTALEHSPEIFQEAFDKNIVLVSPSTLMVTLRTIKNIWRFDQSNKNAQKIAEQAGGILDQFALFTEALEDVGKHIDKTQQAYETAHKRLISGKGNLKKRAESLQSLGVKGKKELPDSLQD